MPYRRPFMTASLLLLCVSSWIAAQGLPTGLLSKDGQTLFPIGFYELPKDDAALNAMAEAGVNLIRCRSRADLDRLQAVGVFGVVPLPLQNGATDALRKTVRELADHPALALWEGPDEVVWNFTAYSGLHRKLGVHSVKGAWWKQTPEAVAYAEKKAGEIIPNMRDAVAMIHELDAADRPVWINEALSSDTYHVRQYLDFVDITGCDIYPIKKTERKVERIGQATDHWIQVGRGKPVYMVLQAFSWDELGDYYGVTETAYPTFDESRFMAYDAIVRRASGILYWGSHYLKSEEFRQSVYALTSELSALQPFLVAPAHPVRVHLIDLPEKTTATGVYATVRKHEDDWLIVIVNEDDVPHMSVVIEGLDELDGRELYLLYGEGTQAVSHGEFIVRTLPREMKVYCTSREWETDRREGREYGEVAEEE